MNNSDIYWVSLRLVGMFSMLKAAFEFMEFCALGAYMLYQALSEEYANCESYIADLTTETLFATTILQVLFFGSLSYYCLFKGSKVHSLLMRLPNDS